MKNLKILIIIVLILLGCSYSYAIDINSWEDLAKIGNDAEYPLTGSYVLTTDLAAADAPSNWDPIGLNFNGTFDGGNHAISGLTMDYTGQGYLGLFGSLTGSGVIKNVGLIDVDITAAPSGNQGNIGALVGYMANTASVENCFSTGTVAVTAPAGQYLRYIGGLIGREYNGTSISDSYSAVDVSVNENNTSKVYFVAGLAGESRSADVDGSYSIGSVTITNPNALTANYKAGFVGVDPSQNGTSNWSENGWYDVSGDSVSSAVKPVTPPEGAVPYDNDNMNNKLAWIVGLDALGFYYFPSDLDLLVLLNDGEFMTIDGLTWTYSDADPPGGPYDPGYAFETDTMYYIQLVTSGGSAPKGGAVPEPATVISFILGGAGLAVKRFFAKK